MTEFSTNNNDLTITNTSHLKSSHLPQNSPQHHHYHQYHPHHFANPFTPSSRAATLQQTFVETSHGNGETSTFKHNSNLNVNLPQHLAQLNRNLLQTHNHTLINHKNSQQQKQILNIENTILDNNIKLPTSAITAAANSPTHYRNPFNSPNNSPFSYNALCYANNNNNNNNKIGKNKTQQQQQQQQQQQKQQNYNQQQYYRYNNDNRTGLFTHNHQQQQHQQYLNNLLVQQQQLAKHQQQLLQAKNTDNEDELSEESLKQNVAIVLNNLNRYNNALRSIILSEQVNNSIDNGRNISNGGGCGVNGGFCRIGKETNTVDGVSGRESCIINNNNILSNMATTATTPESDYNSNPTTPSSRAGILKCDNNVSLQNNSQHVVGYLNGSYYGNGDGGSGGVNGILNNRIDDGGGGGGDDSVNNAFISNNLTCSLASTSDFTHDNSDYQWFLDCGYRDGFNGMQRSVLSSLSASFNAFGSDFIYEDMSKHLDANLAQADIESFRTKDIQLLLSQLPSYCKNLSESRLEQSLLLQQRIDMRNIDWEDEEAEENNCENHNHNQNQLEIYSQVKQQYRQLQQKQQREEVEEQHQQIVSPTSTSTSINDLMIDNSICKSELLFSPVKESHISVDSLDMDCYPEDEDIILTYKANKDNYTIAFEGSVLYSDDSYYEPNEVTLKNKQNFSHLPNNQDEIAKSEVIDETTAHSEQESVNNNKQKNNHFAQLQRYPSGNNNTGDVITIIRPPISATSYNGGVRKSNSLPNFKDDKHFVMSSQIEEFNHHSEKEKSKRQQDEYKKLNVSQAISTSNVEPNLCAKGQNLLPMCQMPISYNSINNSIMDCKEIHEPLQKEEQPNQDEQITNEVGKKSLQQHYGPRHHKHRCSCGTINNPSYGSDNNSSFGSTTQGSHKESKQTHISASALSSGSTNPPAFNLVKLFIKQKSSNCSLEDQTNTQTYMDVSSGCWPSSDLTESSNNSSMEQLLYKKSMNDSGKGSGLSRPEEEEKQEEKDISASNLVKSSTFQMNTEESIPERPSCSPGIYCDEVDNSNSSGSITATNSPVHHVGRNMPLQNPTLKYLKNSYNNKNSNSSTSAQSSDNNSSDLLTQMYKSPEMSSISNVRNDQLDIDENVKTKLKQKQCDKQEQPQISHASSSEMITRSMQTSCGSLHSNRSSLSDRFRCVPPSFLEKLNKLGEERQAPIYVIYPNYALPDLTFVKHSVTPDIIFSPFNYKMILGGVTSSPESSSSSSKKRLNLFEGCEENEILQTVDYKHVVDWVSLLTLLPPDYRRRLKHIPVVKSAINKLESELSHKPLFCSTSTIRRNRSHICDCAQFYQKNQQTEGGGSSSSGSSQQPSSGYRGSSTLLTDSEYGENIGAGTGVDIGTGLLDGKNISDAVGDTLKQMYVYQYEQQRMDGDTEIKPKVKNTTPPQPMPRGILRKSSSAVRNKRNSMIEPGQQQQNQLYYGCSKLTKTEKRRSLQEPSYRQLNMSSEELTEVFEDDYGEVHPRSQTEKIERLSRKDLNARVRAENFLSSLPRHELKYYAEIAAILESSDQNVKYDAAALKKEVSWALSQQKKVSFDDKDNDNRRRLQNQAEATMEPLTQADTKNVKQYRFTTPPNSPNISMGSGVRINNNSRHRLKRDEVEKAATVAAVQRRQENNRFKRMQIQWELMSKDSSMLKELSSRHQTKSGATTPTSTIKSRIPRPVSYPAGKKICNNINIYVNSNHTLRNTKIVKSLQKSPIVLSPPQIDRLNNQCENVSKLAKSPSRIVPPKRYTLPGIPLSTPNTPTITTAGRVKILSNRTAVTAPNTPKKMIPLPRTSLPMVR